MPCFMFEHNWSSSSGRFSGPSEFMLFDGRNWDEVISYINEYKIIDLDHDDWRYTGGRRIFDNKVKALNYVRSRCAGVSSLKYPAAIYHRGDKSEKYEIDAGGEITLIRKNKTAKNDKAALRKLRRRYESNENWGLF